MRFSLAPMEGVTNFPFRNAHAACFPGTDRYYTPFITANQTFSYKTKEKKDTAPENNVGIPLVPQILTKSPEAFLHAAEMLEQKGYHEINLNLGCPSPTVTTHGRGAAMLENPEALDRFFEQLFDGMESRKNKAAVSVKTRIGSERTEESEGLIRIFNRYPIAELTVHPRLRKEMYRGTPHRDVFRQYYDTCTVPLAYNGDVRTPADVRELKQEFPQLNHIMIGRGLLRNPALVRAVHAESEGTQGRRQLTGEEFLAFHDRVLNNWMQDLGQFGNAAGRMKELWYYWGSLFTDAEKGLKKIRKSSNRAEYEAAVRALTEQYSLKEI